MAELTIREARLDDAAAVAALLGELGYPNSAEFAREKLRELEASEPDTVLVAEAAGGVAAVGHLHEATLFHAPGKVGRVMALAVAEGYRRRGAASELLTRLEEVAREAGCTKMEITSGLHRPGAHEFYEGMGYVEKPKRFVKDLRGGPDG
ncbi:MAG: GNAT family N-acetyltransferase [Candidatus Coatesbacteria bacterium]|nr:MAG: GNAT family N-acetyltransferase [Candidatus Coatesbacteria bacterium]